MTVDQAHQAGPRLEVAAPDVGWGTDRIKAMITYSVAGFLVIGGGAAVVFVGLPADKLAIVAGWVSGASVFLFNQEVQTRTARQAASSTAASTAATTATIAAANSGVGTAANGSP